MDSIKNQKCAKHGLLRDSSPRDLQEIFGIHEYSCLNGLRQDQMVMILPYLSLKVFHEGYQFQEHMIKCQEQSIIPPPPRFKTTIVYHSGRTNMSENRHRALCAIYFDLLGEGMSGFSLQGPNNPNHCPWDSAGTEYISSNQLRELRSARDEMEDGSTTGAENQRNNHRRIANDN